MALYRDPVKGLIFRSGKLATSEDCCCTQKGAMCMCEDTQDLQRGCYNNVTVEEAENYNGIYLGDGTECSDDIGISCQNNDDPGPCHPENTCETPTNCLSQFWRVRETVYNVYYGSGNVCDLPLAIDVGPWRGYVGFMVLEFLCDGVWTTMESWTTSSASDSHTLDTVYKTNCTDCP